MIIILGAGGHAKVVADILLVRGVHVVGYLDDNRAVWGQMPLGLPILGSIADSIHYPETLLMIGIGSNAVRYRVSQQAANSATTLHWTTAIHLAACVASSVTVGDGTVICAGAVINPSAVIGAHVIVNTCASVDHDCVIEDFVHIAPGAHLGGGVRVGQGVLIGMGAIILPYRTIGMGAIIAAGSVVTKDVAPNTTIVGTPGRVIETRQLDWRLVT